MRTRGHIAPILATGMLTAGTVCVFILLSFAPAADAAETVTLPEITVTAPASGCTGAKGFVPLECFSKSPKLADAYKTGELGPFMNKVFVGAISLGAILAVLRLAWAGFVYMGTDMWGKKEHAKEVITDTLLGLFLLLSIYLILNQINPQIVSLKVPTAEPPASENYNQGPGSGSAF